jgi:acetyl esterase/lipase
MKDIRKMKLFKTGCLVAFLLSFTVTAFSQPGTKPPIRYLNQIFPDVTVQKDLVFGETVNYEGNDEKLLLDIYSPAGDTASCRPAMLLFHGGGFRPGNDKRQDYIVRTATDFAKRGYVCFSLNYRVRNKPKDDPKNTIEDALADAMKGLNWVRANRQSLKIDDTRIIIGGGSAGGMLAVNFCFRDGSATEKWDKSGIIGMVSLWGGPDPVYRYFTVDKNDPPAILVHGTEDTIVPYKYAVHLVEELKGSQVRHVLLTLDGAGHTPVKRMDLFTEKIAAFLYDLLPPK